MKRKAYQEPMLDDFDNCRHLSFLRKENISDKAEDELAGSELADDEAVNVESVGDKEPFASIFVTYGEEKVLVKLTPMKSEVI